MQTVAHINEGLQLSHHHRLLSLPADSNDSFYVFFVDHAMIDDHARQTVPRFDFHNRYTDPRHVVNLDIEEVG